MRGKKRTVLWSKTASERHDQTAYDIAMQYGEQAANTYLEGIAAAIEIIADNPQIGRNIFTHLPMRRRHVTSQGWEIFYDNDTAIGRIIIIDIQRGAIVPI